MLTRTLIADDHQILRQGISALLQSSGMIEVVGEARTGREAIDLTASLQPDVVVMDIQMPDLNGVDATRQIKALQLPTKIVCLSAFSDQHRASEAISAGASGYVMKDSAFAELATAIEAALRGEIYLSPSVAQSVLSEMGNGKHHPSPSVFRVLSLREREVLQLMAEGQSTKEIAAKLDVSIKTVETHRRNLMEKVQLDSVAELTKFAVREGLTAL